MNNVIIIVKEDGFLKVTKDGKALSICESFGECIRTASAVSLALGIYNAIRVGESAKQELSAWLNDRVVRPILVAFHPGITTTVANK